MKHRDTRDRTDGPRSVAIIMDGNGRWAEQRGLSRSAGHRAGAEAVDRVTEKAAAVGIEYLTLYAFSTENWRRPRREVELLFHLLVRDLKRRGPKCLAQGIRLTSIGRKDRIPRRALRELERVEQETAGGTRMTLCLALDYGGMWDLLQIAETARRLEREGKCEGPLGEEDLARLIGSSKVPPVDLLIRPGGESRVSNFLPYQLSYAELLFLDKLWPDFDGHDLETAVDYFRGKNRRFGGLTAGTLEAVELSPE